jgi:hypothetical protein
MSAQRNLPGVGISWVERLSHSCFDVLARHMKF